MSIEYPGSFVVGSVIEVLLGFFQFDRTDGGGWSIDEDSIDVGPPEYDEK